MLRGFFGPIDSRSSPVEIITMIGPPIAWYDDVLIGPPATVAVRANERKPRLEHNNRRASVRGFVHSNTFRRCVCRSMGAVFLLLCLISFAFFSHFPSAFYCSLLGVKKRATA